MSDNNTDPPEKSVTDFIVVRLELLNIMKEKGALPVDEGFIALDRAADATDGDKPFDGMYKTELVQGLSDAYKKAEAEFRQNWWHQKIMVHMDKKSLSLLLAGLGPELDLPSDETAFDVLLAMGTARVKRIQNGDE
tara:strand:+ start:4682 stop:5089 length:408 start_codon:yes stop_codon:yes gene_type:complete